MHAALQSVHRSAKHTSVLGLHAVFDGNKSFSIFRGDAEDTRQPTPQDSSRTAQGDSGRHTNDVSRTDRCGERRGEGSKLRHVAGGSLVPAHGKSDSRKNLTLRKRRRKVKYICVPRSMMIMGQPHKKLLTAERKSLIASISGELGALLLQSYQNSIKKTRFFLVVLYKNDNFAALLYDCRMV